MKIFKSPLKVIILFLSVLIVISSIMIVRLESKAANLQTQWEEHEKSLKKNEDVLSKLELFARSVKKNTIKIDGNDINLLANDTKVSVGNDQFSVSTNGIIKLGDKQDTYISYDPNMDLAYLKNGDAHVSVGNTYQDGTRWGVLIQADTDKHNINISEIAIIIGSKEIDGYRLNMIPNKDLVELTKGKSKLIFNKNNIKIEAVGDINITSKNGNVNINGKKVNLNE
jgi:hypothetical protein